MPATTRRRQDLAPAGQANDFDLDGGLFVDLAMQGRMQGLAEFDPAARQRVKALARGASATHDEHAIVAEDGGADGKLWSLRMIGEGHAGSYCLSMISAQTLRVCRRENRFTLFRIKF